MSELLTTDERTQALALANRLLDEPNADPDDDLRTLSRQLLRQHEKDATAIWWIKPIIVDGVARYPECEAEVVAEQSRIYRARDGRRERDEPDYICRLSAKVEYRGKNLCRRHASALALNELAKHR